MRQVSSAVTAFAWGLVDGSSRHDAVNARISHWRSAAFPTMTCFERPQASRLMQPSLHAFKVIAHVLHMHAQQASLDPADQLAVVQSPLKASGVRFGAASEEGVPASTTPVSDGFFESLEQAAKCKSVTRAPRAAMGLMARRAT